MEDTFTITELAREFNISTRSIRHYEEVGLVFPTRKGSTRIYSRRDRIRLKLTLRGKRLGFSLAECREMIDLYDATASNNNRQLRTVIEKINLKRLELEQQLKDIKAIQAGLDELETMCEAAMKKNESKKNESKKSESKKSESGKKNRITQLD